MKRETKKVAKKASKPKGGTARKPLSIADIAAAARAEGMELHIRTEARLDGIPLNVADSWKDEVRLVEKLTGVPALEVMDRLVGEIVRQYPSHVQIGRLVVNQRHEEEIKRLRVEADAEDAKLEAEEDAAEEIRANERHARLLAVDKAAEAALVELGRRAQAASSVAPNSGDGPFRHRINPPAFHNLPLMPSDIKIELNREDLGAFFHAGQIPGIRK